MKKIIAMTAILSMALSMVQCTSNQKQEPIPVGSTWKLESMIVDNNSVPAPAGKEVTIGFADSTKIGGNAGCNYYFGSYKIGEKNTIQLEPMGMTKMACPDMEFEDQFIANMFKIKTYSLKDNVLALSDSLGQKRMILVPLQAEKAE